MADGGVPTSTPAAAPSAEPAAAPAQPESNAPASGAAALATQQEQHVAAQTTPAPSPDPSGEWYANIDAEYHGFIQDKGFKSENDLAKSLMHAQKMIGVPTEEILRIPKPEDADGMAALYNRLGRPETPQDYKIEGLDDGDFGNWFLDTVHATGLNTEQATKLATQYDEFIAGQNAIEDQKFAETAQLEMNELRKNWGRDADLNFEMARRGSEFLGLSQEQLSNLERGIGTTAMMEAMKKIGSSFSEGDFVSNNEQTPGQAITQEAAKSKYNELKNDPEFQKRYLSKDKSVAQKAAAELHHLSKLAFD